MKTQQENSTMAVRNFIGIDPAYGKPCAYAYEDHSFVWHHGEFSSSDPHEMTKIFKTAKKHGVNALAIEGQYLGKNPKVFQQLSIVSERVRIYAMLSMGIQAVTIAPRTWQSAIAVQGTYTAKKHDDIIRLARWYAIGASKLHHLTEDECCAICIAQYANLYQPELD